MSFMQALREKLTEVKEDIIADKSISDTRIAICNSCEFLLITRNCAKCGCFVDAKTKVLKTKCPLRKW